MKTFFSKILDTTPSNEDFVSMHKDGVVQVSDFQGGVGKYISTVVDGDVSERVFRESSKMKILGTYISDKNKIVGIKIEKYEKGRGGIVLPNPTTINISLDQASVLQEFIEFLQKADLSSISKGKIILADSLELDSKLQSKLLAISKDPKGKDILEKFLENDYIASGEAINSAINLLKGIKQDGLIIDSIKSLVDGSGLDIADLIRHGLSSAKISEKIEQLNKFKNLISKPDVKEVSDIHHALQDMPWIFGPEYASLDVRDAGNSGIPDRRLKRVDGLSDILEIKLPKEEVLRIDTQGRHFMAPKLAESLGQLTGYLEHFYSEYSTDFDDETKNEIPNDSYGKYYKPKGILLIGRRYTKDGTNPKVSETTDALPKYLRRLTSYFHWIDVLTYDDLIERAENFLKTISK